MARVMDVKNSKGFCDEVFTQLSGMRKKMSELKDMSRSQGANNEIIGMFERHLSELVEEIDWKIQILAHSCPYDWKGSIEFENDVHVGSADESEDADFSPGYLGG